MLKISQAQLAAFAGSVDLAFRTRLAARVQERQGGMPEPAARDLADRTIALGERFGIVTAAELLRFVEIVLRLGPGFTEQEDCARVVQLLELDGPGWQRINRVQMLLDGVDPEQREAAFVQAVGAAHG